MDFHSNVQSKNSSQRAQLNKIELLLVKQESWKKKKEKIFRPILTFTFQIESQSKQLSKNFRRTKL